MRSLSSFTRRPTTCGASLSEPSICGPQDRGGKRQAHRALESTRFTCVTPTDELNLMGERRIRLKSRACEEAARRKKRWTRRGDKERGTPARLHRPLSCV